jgi:hypothetical protein
LSITQDELARAVAAEMGGAVAAATEKALCGEATRDFSIGDAMAVAGFIVQATQFALQIYRSNKDRAALAARLEAETPASPRLDAAKRSGIIARIVDTLAGS